MEKEISFRKAKIEDTLRLSVLFKQVYVHTYGTNGVSDEFANFITKQFAVERLEKRIIEDPNSFIVAVNNDNLVGAAEVEFEKECPVNKVVAPELDKLYVLEWFSGIGVGYGLLKEVEKIVAAKGYKKVWLSVYSLNEKAIRFYERQGYKCIGIDWFQMELNKYENKVMIKVL